MPLPILWAALAAGLVWLLWKIRGALLTPVARGKHLRLDLVLWVTGPAPELEAAVRGLVWLLRDGVLYGSVRLVDRGMDRETREIARRLASETGNVSLWTKETKETPSP